MDGNLPFRVKVLCLFSGAISCAAAGEMDCSAERYLIYVNQIRRRAYQTIVISHRGGGDARAERGGRCKRMACYCCSALVGLGAGATDGFAPAASTVVTGVFISLHTRMHIVQAGRAAGRGKARTRMIHGPGWCSRSRFPTSCATDGSRSPCASEKKIVLHDSRSLLVSWYLYGSELGSPAAQNKG